MLFSASITTQFCPTLVACEIATFASAMLFEKFRSVRKLMSVVMSLPVQRSDTALPDAASSDSTGP